MMWGPAVARAAAELALNGGTDIVDVTDLGLDRFDERRPLPPRGGHDRAAVPGRDRGGSLL